MSVTTPVGPREVQDFQFKLLCRIRVFNQQDDNYIGFYNLLATASKYGLLFVGCRDKLLAILLPHVLENENPLEQISRGSSHGGIEIVSYPRRELQLPHAVSHLGVNCDQSLLAVAVMKGGCSHALIYDIASFFSKNIRISKEIRLSTSPDAHILELSWNPGISNVLACCLSNGSVGIYEFKNGGVDINHLPPEAQATCFSWSPKGKQLVVGSKNGSLTQHKPDLKAVKSIPAPNVFEGPSSVLNILWISNYQFAAVYRDSSNENERPSLMIVNAPKGGGVTYVNFEDICYSSGNLRTPQFYLCHQANWNVIIVGSANSMEVGVLGLAGDQLTWEHWLQEDASRAELPLTSLKEETFPLGLCLDTSTQRQLLLGENQVLPPMPVLALMSHRGVLCLFYAINIVPGAAVVCTPPERVTDESILQFFLTTPEAEASGTDIGRSPPPVSFQQAHPASPLPVLTSPSNLLFPSTPQQTLSTPTQPVLSATSPEKKFLDWSTPLTSVMDSNRLGRCINLNEKFDQTPQTQPTNSVELTLVTSANDSLEPTVDSASVPPMTGVNSKFGVGPSPATGSFFGDFSVPSTLQINVGKVNEGPSTQGNLLATPATGNNSLNFTFPAASSTPNLVQSQKSSLKQNTSLLQADKTVNYVESTGNTGIHSSELPLTAVPNHAKDGVVEGGDSEVGKSKKMVNSDVLYLAIQQEMNLFEKEKSDLMSRLSKVNVEIGTPEEKEWLRSKGDALESFSHELQSTTSTHIAEVQALKSLLVESLAWVEDARSRAAQENDPCWLQIVRSEELDPVSSRTLGTIKQLAYYVESQLIQVDRSLDLQWANFQESCRDKIKGRLYIPSLEAVYQAMVLQSNILAKQKANVRRIVEKTAKHKPNKNNSLLGTSLSVLQTKSDTGLAVLAENLLQMRLGATCTSMEGSDISEIMAAGRYSMVASMATKLTPRKLETLREFLTQGSVRHTKPVKHTNSSLKSLAIDKIAESYEVILSNSVTPPSTIFNLDQGKIDLPLSKSCNSYEINSKFLPNKPSGLGLFLDKSHLKGEKQDISLSGEQSTPSDILGHIAKSVESKFKESETFPRVSFSSRTVSGENSKIQDTLSESISATTEQSLPPSFSPQVNTSSSGAVALKSKGTTNFTFGSSSQSSLGGQAKCSNTGSFNFQLSTPTSVPSFVYTLNKKSGFNFSSPGATPTTTSNSVQFFGSVSETCEPATTSGVSFAFGSLSVTSTSSSTSTSLASKSLFGQPLSANATVIQPSETPLFSSSNINAPFSFSMNSAPLPGQTTPAKSMFSGISAKSSTESNSFSLAAADSTSQPATTKSISNLSTGSPNTTTFTNGSHAVDLTQNSSNIATLLASKPVGTVPVDFGFSQLSSALNITSVSSRDATVETKARNVETPNAASSIGFSGSAVTSVSTIPNTPKTFSFSGPNTSLSTTSAFSGKTPNDNENKSAPGTTSVTFFGQPVCSPSSFPQSAGSLFGQKTSIFGGACNTSLTSSSPTATSLNAMSRSSEDKNVTTPAKSSTISLTVTSSDLPIQVNTSISSQGSISSIPSIGTLGLSHPSSGTTTASLIAPSMSFGKVVTSAGVALFGGCTPSIASVIGNSAPAVTTITAAPAVTTITAAPAASITATTPAPTITSCIAATTATATPIPTSTITAAPTATTTIAAPTATTTIAAPTATTTIAAPTGASTTTTAASTAPTTTAASIVTTTSATSTGTPISSVLTTITTTTITTSPSVFGSGSLFGQATNASISIFKPQGTTTVFGQGPTTSVGSSFGPNSTTSTSSLFGQTSSAPPVFGLTSSGNTSVFGQATATTTGALFSGTVTSSGTLGFGHHSSTAKTVSVFGQPATTTGASVFGQPTTSTTTPVFGQTSSSLFGQPTTSSSVFGQTTTAAPVFGQTVATTTVAPAFGSGNSATSIFGQSSATTSSSIFGQPASTSTSVFGGTSNAFGQPSGSFMGGSQPSFGGNATFGQSGGSLFGQSGTGFGSTGGSLFGGGGSTTSGSTFGTAGNLFQSPSPGNVFGGSSTTSGSVGGAFSAPQGQSIAESGFGSPSAFGQKSGNFGSPPAFGQSPAGCGFGGSPTFGGAPTFGGSPIFGSPNRSFGSTSPSSGSGIFGGNGGQQQGSSTFENLASQNTMTFGNLASGQSSTFGSSGGSLFGGTASSQPQQSSSFQSTSTFGGSSFSSWR